MYLEILSYIANKNNRLSDLENIFFLNSKKTFINEEEKVSFFYKYAKINKTSVNNTDGFVLI